MNEQHSHDPIVPDIDAARRIAIACRRREADWRAGRSGAIGDYHGDVPEAGRRVLRVKLEALEREFREAEEGRTGSSRRQGSKSRICVGSSSRGQ
jgi:hypothetical protein